MESIGWKETKENVEHEHERSKLRGRILREAVRNGHSKTTTKALAFFDAVKRGETIDLSPDTFEAIYIAGVLNGDESDYEFVLDRFLNTTFAPEQIRLLHALASTPVPYLQQRTLELAVSDAVRPQDTISVISSVAVLTPIGHVSVWIFLMANWDDISSGNKFGSFGKLVGNFIDL